MALLIDISEFVSEINVPVAMAVGIHPFPFRTRKLSPPAPMVLGEKSPGRVGRRRASFKQGALLEERPLFCMSEFAESMFLPMPEECRV